MVLVIALIATLLIVAQCIERYKESWAPCPHGIKGGIRKKLCTQCNQARIASELAQRESQEKVKHLKDIGNAADKLMREEASRLAGSFFPTLDELRNLTPQQFEDQIAAMFTKLGFKVEQTPYANDQGRDAIMYKNSEKYLVECKRYQSHVLSGRPELQKFHSAIVTDKAKKGYFVSTSGFARPAIEFAKSVPIELIDGSRLLELMFESTEKQVGEVSYKTMCRQCSAIVVHDLRNPVSVMCDCGYEVRPSLSITKIMSHKIIVRKAA